MFEWEVHLTIDTQLDDVALALACADRGLELTRLALASGAHAAQRMATLHVCGSLDDVRAAARAAAHALADVDAAIVRTKIECPIEETPKRATTIYLEHHVLLSSVGDVRALCRLYGARLSSSSKSATARYATIRHAPERWSVGASMALVARFRRDVVRSGAGKIVKTISERCVVDTNAAVDRGWEIA